MEVTRIITLARCHLTQNYALDRPIRIVSLRPVSMTFPYETDHGETIRGTFLITADDFPFATRCRGRVRYTGITGVVVDKPYTWKATVVLPHDSSGTYEHAWSSDEENPMLRAAQPVFANGLTITLDFVDLIEPPTKTIADFAELLQPIGLTFELKTLE